MSYNSKYKGYEVEAFLDKIVDFENQEFVNKEVFTETLNSYVKNDTFDSKINNINSNINNINSDINDVRIWKNKLADSLKYDNDKKCWYIDGDFYVTGIFGVGAAGEEGGTSGGGGGIDEDTLRDFLTENRYATEDWVTALGYITAGEVDTKLTPYATSASVTAQVSAVASGILNLTERVTPIESWKDRLSKALKYNEQEQCWYIDGKFYVTETLGVGGIAEGGNGGSGGEGTLTGILVNGQKYDSPDEYGILSLPNYPTQEEFDGISERFQTIESYFSSSEDYDDTINKWNEIVSFLNATEGTTLAGILAAYTLKKDFNELSVTVGENSQAIDNHETRIQTWEEWFNSTGKHLLYDKNSNALYSENFYTRGWNAAGGIGEAGSTPEGGGGGRVNGITLNNVNYTEVDAYGNLIISELFATSADAEALVEEIEKLKNAGHITADALIPYIKTTDADAKYSTKKYVDDTFATKVALQNLSLSVDKNAEDIVKHDGRIDSLEEWYNNVGKHILYDSDNKSVYTENFYTTKVLGAGAVGEEGNGGSGAIVDYDSVIQAIGYVPANEVTVDAISNEVSLINNEIDGIEEDIVTINQRFADYYTQDEADNKLTESINGLASDVAESLNTKANKDGSNATGNWGIGITGNAATATKLNDNSEYTIWGQKFFKDGKPSSVNGDMAVTGNASISGTTSVKTLKVGNIELTDDNGRLKVKGDVAVTGTLGVGGIGEEGGSSGGSGSVNGISIDGKTYSPTDGIIDLTQPFANVEVDLSDYYTKQEVDNKTAPLATRDFVTTEIGKIDLSPYAKSKDVQDTYATKKSLSTLQGEVDNIESILGLGEEAEGYINTWGEVKDFLDKISVTDDLADTLLGINTELGNKALGSDLDAAVKRVGALEGYFDNGIAKKATADANGNTITSTYAKQATTITAGKGLTGGGSLAENRTINVVSANDGIIVNDDNIQLNTINNLSTDSSTKPLSAAQGKALSDRLAVFENWFKADGDDTIKTTFNFFTTKTLATGEAGEAGGGTGGGATVDYDSVVDALGFTPANVIDLDALATTVGGKQDAINTLTQNAWEAVVAKTGEVDDKLDATTAASTYLKKTDAASTYLGINAKAVSAGTADSATKATKATNDGSGNEITKTYATKTELSSKGTYSKPSGGIPKSDLANAVQVSLGKADTALQEEEDPIFSAHVASDITAEDLAKWDSVDNKVDKVSGKGLSTEDFTTALKTKLEGLSNYDDTAISNAISSVENNLNALLEGDDSNAIDNFKEIMSFLRDIEDTESLDAIIASIESQIAGKMDKVTLATVATSGSYNDLSNKPTIPSLEGYATETWVNNQNFKTKQTAVSSPTAQNASSSEFISDITQNENGVITATKKLLPWNSVGVTEVKMSVPVGLTVTGSPITSKGTLAVTMSEGYFIPTNAEKGNWDEAWSWGDHANAGYATQSWVSNQGFALTSYLNSYLLKSGGTLTGELTIDAGAGSGLNITGGGITSKIYNAGGFFILDSGSSGVNFTSSSLYCGANGYEIYHSGNLTDLATIRSNASLGASAYNTLSSYNLQDISENASLGATAYSSLSGYLPLSGGMLTGNGAGILSVNRQDGNPVIEFRNNGSLKGRYGFTTDGTPIGVVNGSQVTLIHSGNIGDYALKKVANVSSLDAINAGEFFYSSYRPTSIPKGNYVGGVTLQTFQDAANDYRAQLAFSTEAECFVRRYMNGSWGGWKTIAFTSHLDNYLPKSGGTLTGSLRISGGADRKIVLDNTDADTNYNFILFCQNGVEYGHLGTASDTNLKWNGNTLIHSGNIGSYASLSGAYPTSAGSYNYTFASGIYTVNGVEENLPISEAGNLVVNANYDSKASAQLYMRTSSDALYYRRKRSGTWYDWKTIAFTDSNVASATKLATARTIWGQSFDGSASVRGNLFLAPTTDDGNALSEKIVFTGYNGRYYGPMIGTVASSNTGGYGRKDLVVWQYNKASWASDTSGHEVALLINPSGNVTIGGSDLAETNYKLFVNGKASFRHAILADRYNGQGNTAGASIIINKGGNYFGIGPSANNVSDISLGYASDNSGTWKSEFLTFGTNGNATFSGNITASAFYMSSDETLKDFGKDIEIDFERLKNLPKKYFTWKSGGERQIGTSAQEVQKLFPELVGKKVDGTLTVDYGRLTMPALAAIDKLYTENQELKADNQELKARLTKLEMRIYG